MFIQGHDFHVVCECKVERDEYNLSMLLLNGVEKYLYSTSVVDLFPHLFLLISACSCVFWIK